MSKIKKPIGLGFVDKAEVCKRQAIAAFNLEWSRTHSREHAFESAKVILENCIERNNIRNKGAITGLNGELLFYYLSFDSYQLSPEMAAGLRTDFRGIVQNEPSAIDVTTDLRHKEPAIFKKIFPEFQSNWKYYIGVVELSRPSFEIYPLLLPVCNDRNVGHFVLVIEETTQRSLGGPAGALSDHQVLVHYNPMAEDDETAIEKIVAEYNYIITKPSYYYDELMIEDLEIYGPDVVKRRFRDFVEDLAFEYRKISDLVLSAIVEVKYAPAPRSEEGSWETFVYWSHPHDYVKRRIGKAFGILEHNIAGVVYDDY